MGDQILTLKSYLKKIFYPPSLILGIILLLSALVIEWLTLRLGRQDFKIVRIAFWVIPIVFFHFAIFNPRLRMASLFAFIFWLPGPIDVLGKVPVSFYSTADWMRAFSILDLFMIVLIFLPTGFRPSIRLPRRAIIWRLLMLAIFVVFINTVIHFVLLDTDRRYALLMASMFGRFVLVYRLVYKYINDFSDLRRLYWGGIVAMFGLLVNTVFTNLSYSGAGRLNVATFGNNIFSALLAVFFLLIFILITDQGAVFARFILIGGLIFCLIGILLSGARIGIVLIILGLLMTLIVSRGFSSRVLLRWGSLAVFILFAVWVSLQVLPKGVFAGLDRITSLLSLRSDTSPFNINQTSIATFNVRVIFWESAIDILNSSPWIGIGPGQWNYERSLSAISVLVEPNGVRDSISDPHNGFVLVAVENGYPVLFIYVIMILVALLKGLNTLYRYRLAYVKKILPKMGFMYLVGWFSSYCMLIIGQFSNSYINNLYLQIYFGIFLFTLLRLEYFLSAKMPNHQLT